MNNAYLTFHFSESINFKVETNAVRNFTAIISYVKTVSGSNAQSNTAIVTVIEIVKHKTFKIEIMWM